MRCSLPLALSLCALLLCAVPARGQEAAALPSTPVLFPSPPDAPTGEEARALDAWLAGMRKWQRMDKRWHNAPAHDAVGRIIPRTARPEPPAWLEARCGALRPGAAAALPNSFGAACRIIAGLAEDPIADAIRASTLAARNGAETTVKHSFLRRVHLDGLWTSTSTDVRMYGLFGAHISLVDGRVQFFGPPGVIVLSVPDGRGAREMRTGYTWGMSVRLRDVRLFAPSRNMTLFLTLTKVWMTGGTYDRLRPGGVELAGFSLAPRKRN
jgi:hypothetical protein